MGLQTATRDTGTKGWKIRDRQRNGKPSAIPKGEMDKIKQELSDSNIEWGFRQVVDLVQKRTRVRHHEVHICRLLHKWGFKSKVRRNGLSEEPPGKRKTSLKKHEGILTHLKNDWNVLVQDESIFTHQ